MLVIIGEPTFCLEERRWHPHRPPAEIQHPWAVLANFGETGQVYSARLFQVAKKRAKQRQDEASRRAEPVPCPPSLLYGGYLGGFNQSWWGMHNFPAGDAISACVTDDDLSEKDMEDLEMQERLVHGEFSTSVQGSGGFGGTSAAINGGQDDGGTSAVINGGQDDGGTERQEAINAGGGDDGLGGSAVHCSIALAH